MSATTISAEVYDRELVGSLEVIRRANDLPNLVDVFVEAGINQATGYRRIKDPGDIKVEELAAIASRFDIPIHVIAEGELATLRYIKAPTLHPDDPGGLEVSRRAWNGDNVVPLRPATPLRPARDSAVAA